MPRWPAAVALLVIGAAYATISERLKLGPSGLLLGVVAVVLVMMASTRLSGYHRLTRLLALGLIGAVTVAVAVSVLFLVSLLPRGEAMPAPQLLRDAALIWVINVVTFAVWYWEIDGGGPQQRRRDAHESSDFLFPQMNEKGKARSSGPRIS